jgi:hypothetical protein
MSNDPQLLCAAKHLIEAYGTKATSIAVKRAANVGKDQSPVWVWSEIAGIIRDLPKSQLK